MESINQIAKKEQQTKKLQISGQNFLTNKNTHFEISAYSDQLTVKGAAEGLSLLKAAFPSLGPQFHEVFGKRIKELGIGDKRLMDSINHVIDNCEYPTPTIAQFISFDKKIDLYTHPQMIKLNNDYHGKAFELYNAVQVGIATKPMWASVQDIENYGLTRYKHKNE